MCLISSGKYLYKSAALSSYSKWITCYVIWPSCSILLTSISSIYFTLSIFIDECSKKSIRFYLLSNTFLTPFITAWSAIDIFFFCYICTIYCLTKGCLFDYCCLTWGIYCFCGGTTFLMCFFFFYGSDFLLSASSSSKDSSFYTTTTYVFLGRPLLRTGTTGLAFYGCYWLLEAARLIYLSFDCYYYPYMVGCYFLFLLAPIFDGTGSVLSRLNEGTIYYELFYLVMFLLIFCSWHASLITSIFIDLLIYWTRHVLVVRGV